MEKDGLFVRKRKNTGGFRCPIDLGLECLSTWKEQLNMNG